MFVSMFMVSTTKQERCIYENPLQCTYPFYHVRQDIHVKFHRPDNMVSCCPFHECLGLIDS